MAYTPIDLEMDEWTSPRTISGGDVIANLDETVNDIVSDNTNSIKNFLNAQMAKLPPYLTAELSKIADEVESYANSAKNSANDAEESADRAENSEYRAEGAADRAELYGGLLTENLLINSAFAFTQSLVNNPIVQGNSAGAWKTSLYSDEDETNEAGNTEITTLTYDGANYYALKWIKTDTVTAGNIYPHVRQDIEFPSILGSQATLSLVGKVLTGGSPLTLTVRLFRKVLESSDTLYEVGSGTLTIPTTARRVQMTMPLTTIGGDTTHDNGMYSLRFYRDGTDTEEIAITNVKLERNASATTYQQESIGDVELDVLRYKNVITGFDSVNQYADDGNTDLYMFHIDFPVPMYRVPTIAKNSITYSGCENLRLSATKTRLTGIVDNVGGGVFSVSGLNIWLDASVLS